MWTDIWDINLPATIIRINMKTPPPLFDMYKTIFSSNFWYSEMTIMI